MNALTHRWFGVWQVVLLCAAVLAVQASEGSDYQFDSFDFNNLKPLMSALGSLTPFNREKNVAQMRNILPPAEFQTMMHGLMTLDRANETIQRAFPPLRESLSTLADALPSVIPIVVQYQLAGKKGKASYSKDIIEKLFKLTPVLNEALEQLTPAFPILADTLTMLSKELHLMSTAIPALSRSMSSQNAVIRSQMAFALPAYGKASDSFHDNLSKFHEYALPYLISFLSSLNRYARTGDSSAFQHSQPMNNLNFPASQQCGFQQSQQFPYQNML